LYRDSEYPYKCFASLFAGYSGINWRRGHLNTLFQEERLQKASGVRNNAPTKRKIYLCIIDGFSLATGASSNVQDNSKKNSTLFWEIIHVAFICDAYDTNQ
jgi:hypothetical protein